MEEVRRLQTLLIEDQEGIVTQTTNLRLKGDRIEAEPKGYDHVPPRLLYGLDHESFSLTFGQTIVGLRPRSWVPGAIFSS